MAEYNANIKNIQGLSIPVVIKRDKRLKKTLRWAHEPDGSILVRVPMRYPKRLYKTILKDIQVQISKPKKVSKHRTDTGLQKRAEEINREFFSSELKWVAIRWVNNMNTRLGSCTNGGSTDGHIRISNKIKTWPSWVVDYVIAHELAHRKHRNHNKAFWNYLRNNFPKTEQARGFIKGVGFGQGTEIEE